MRETSQELREVPRGLPDEGEPLECEQEAVEVVVMAVGANGRVDIVEMSMEAVNGERRKRGRTFQQKTLQTEQREHK